MMRKSIIVIVLFIIGTSCTDPINFPSNDGIDRLVVDGYIDDLSGQHTVILSTTSSLSGVGINNLGVGAQVNIIDDTEDLVIELKEIRSGTYVTDFGAIIGQIGHSYRLDISLKSGEKYESTAQTIPEKIEISSAFEEFVQEPFTDNLGNESINSFYRFNLDLANGSADQFFKIDGHAFSEVFIGFVDDACFPDDPPFPSLSCWRDIRQIDNSISIGSNDRISSATYGVVGKETSFVSQGRYVAELEVKSMQKEANIYWCSVKNQLERSGNIFDPPLPPTAGNIKNINNPNETVLGFFGAYSVTRQKLCFQKEMVAELRDVRAICFPTICTSEWSPAVNELEQEYLACFN